MNAPKTLTQARRSEVLLRNQHACCICGDSGVQIHHINGDRDDNRFSNLAVLCLEHHDEATPPQSGLTAKLREEEIREYKEDWEEKCRKRREKAARSRTAFFMVDYKNAERLRQLFSRLAPPEYEEAYQKLREELKVESKLREEQGFDASIEPTLTWSQPVKVLLNEVRAGQVHPEIFEGADGHARDPLMPSGPTFTDNRIPLYDVWCQLMARALIAVRTPYLMQEFAQLEKPMESGFSGKLVAFEGNLEGDVVPPSEWEETPVSETRLEIRNEGVKVRTDLSLKTHYIYSVTGAESLEEGRGCGLLFLRNFSDVSTEDGVRTIEFDCSPLIIGSGGGKLLEIP